MAMLRQLSAAETLSCILSWGFQMASSARFAVAILIVALSAFSTVSAQIIEDMEVDGKTIQCIRGGFGGPYIDYSDCNANEWFTYVFVGTIYDITPADDDQETLLILPQEVFGGEPPIPVAETTSQKACLPKLIAGDRWLFLLDQRLGNPIVLGYGNHSRPVAEAQEQIQTLRRLKKIGDFGLLRGDVVRGPNCLDGNPVPGVRIIATRLSDHAKFFAKSDADGHFEFEPLSIGKYELAADSISPIYVGDAALKVTGGQCRKVTLCKPPEPGQ
jgi:hypothetical protein